jgi:hypothetical protein
MTDRHTSPGELDAYVRDALEPHAVDALEAHVSGCARCTRQLQAAARLELQLAEMAAAAPRPRWRSVSRIAPLAALATALLVVVLLPRPAARPVLDDGEPWAPDAPLGPVQTVSIQFDISEMGRRTLPRYEEMAISSSVHDPRDRALP